MARESARIRRRRAAIYRRQNDVREAQDARAKLDRLGRTDPFTRGIYDGRVAQAERRAADAWDALRRAEMRERRTNEPSFFDPTRLPKGYTTLHGRVRTNEMRSHSHAHRKPSHHVGPCDLGCRLGGRSHYHYGREYRQADQP